MKRLFHTAALIAALAFAVTAHATSGGEGNNTGCNGVGNANSPCTGSTASNGGAGGNAESNAASVALAAAQANASANAAAIAAQQQAQQQAQAMVNSGNSNNRNSNAATGGSSNATGGNASASGTGGNATALGGNGAGNTTIVGGTNVERSAPSMAMDSPHIPLKSCRLYVSLFGSSVQGGGGAGIPIGNDKTCLSGAKIDAMTKVGGFTVEDLQRAACEIEGMEDMSVCKAIRNRSPEASAELQKFAGRNN